MRKMRGLLIGLITALGASSAYAHDFFLLPEQFSTSWAGPLNVQATVGSSFPTP
jgi:hypothetical protein